jgi:hypothetical protein
MMKSISIPDYNSISKRRISMPYAKQNRWHDQYVRHPKENGQYAFQEKSMAMACALVLRRNFRALSAASATRC